MNKGPGHQKPTYPKCPTCPRRLQLFRTTLSLGKELTAPMWDSHPTLGCGWTEQRTEADVAENEIPPHTLYPHLTCEHPDVPCWLCLDIE